MSEEKIIKELNKPENKLIMECNSKDKQIDLCRSILLDILKEKVEKDKEIERLNNIINEFDKWLLGEQMMFYRSSDNERLIRFGETKCKWLELKGDSSNE